MVKNNSYIDEKRNAVKIGLMILPSMFYFHKNRAALLKSAYATKNSYYNPGDQGLGYGTLHHVKEFAARLFFGYLLGVGVSSYLYGFKKVDLDAKTLEILDDEDSLQYA
jgi:hypothetical protein